MRRCPATLTLPLLYRRGPDRRLAPPCRVRLASSCTQLYAASVGWFHGQPIMVDRGRHLQGLTEHALWLRRVAGEGERALLRGGTWRWCLMPCNQSCRSARRSVLRILRISTAVFAGRRRRPRCPVRRDVHSVDVARCGLAAVPEALAGMESMTSLDFSFNPRGAAGSTCSRCASCGS